MGIDHLDLDWFFCDHEGMVGFAASGGGSIPQILRSIVDSQSLVSKFFRTDFIHEEEAILNSTLDLIKNFKSDRDGNQYAQDFILMSRKGLFSFDITFSDGKKRETYHLVSKPISPVYVTDLPNTIAQNIKLKALFSLNETNEFTINDFEPR